MSNPWLLLRDIRPQICVLLCLLAFVFISKAAHAHSAIKHGDNDDLANLTSRAELIAITRVEDVRYVTASFSDQSGQMPVTFVTYRLEKLLRGKQTSPILTLRFMGGSDGMGGFMGVSGVPKFQIGDRDLLFVVDNGTKTCALALCEWGRFRILNERVYNTHGFAVLGLPKNRVIAFGMPPEAFQVFRYPAPEFDAIMKNPLLQKEIPRLIQSSGMSVEQARAEYKAKAKPYIEMRTKYDPRDFEATRAELTQGNPSIPAAAVSQILARASQDIPPNAGKGAMSLNDFTNAVTRLISSNRRSFRLIESADASAPVVFKPIARVKGPAPKRVLVPPLKETAAESAWRQAEDRDPFNPGQKPKGAK